MKTANELILSLLKGEFERNNLDLNDTNSSDNVWVMCAAVIPFSENSEAARFLPYVVPDYENYTGTSDDEKRSDLLKSGIPTHIVRIILRNTWPRGTLPYVDGTDVYVSADAENQTAEFIWEEIWAGDAPKYHGGTVGDSMEWAREMSEPFYIQFKDPFLNEEQRIALNGHEEEYI
ncbi:MAG: hypothetical protein JWM44_965 [Bacilli bacterium]|nr:hypothetical protein [Bacilli bacterium]